MSEVTERIKERFIICYDKFSKPMAISLRNSITEIKETCVLWTEATYNENEPKLTNRNLLVLLSEEMVKEHLANPEIVTINFSDGVILKHEGNTIGLMIDPNISYEGRRTEKEINKCIAKGLLIPVVGTYLAIKQENRVLNKINSELMFDAVNKLKAGTIEKFLRGERLD